MNMRVDVAERLHFEVRDQLVDTLYAVEERRYDDHRPRRRRHRVVLEARKPAWRNQIADHPLHHLDGQLARGHDRQERDEKQRGAVPAVP